MVCLGPVNHFLAERCHQIAEDHQRADRQDRRVVDELPREVLVARDRRRGERQDEVDRDDRDLRDRDRVHPLVLRCRASRSRARTRRRAASAGRSGSGTRGRARSPPPRRRRRTRPAPGAPLMSTWMSAGSVISAPTTATKITALAGISCAACTLDSHDDPGIAPSRLNAKVIREALVRQAVVQNSCPAVEISSTRKCQPVGSACSEDQVDGAAARGDLAGVLHREHEREQQHVAADRRVEDRAPDALRGALGRALRLLGEVGGGVEAGDRVLRQQEAQRQHQEPVGRRCCSRSC